MNMTITNRKTTIIITAEECARLLAKDKLTNEDRSALEVYEFVHNPPEKYFLYINETKKTATTWMGDFLGDVWLGSPYRTAFGDTRVNITVNAINGKRYHGTYFKSAGDYARIKLFKHQ